jgi:hypothetical protein
MIHELINSIWNTEKLPYQWKESIIIPVHNQGDKTDCSNYWGITTIKFIQNFIEYSSLKAKSIHKLNYWGSSVWIGKCVICTCVEGRVGL